MNHEVDVFESYLTSYPNSPEFVLIRSVEAKNFPVNHFSSPILDLCCGDGFFATRLGLENAYGCDVSAEVIQEAKKRPCYQEAEICDARDLSLYSNNFFGSVISNCALEHVDDIQKAIISIHRVLKADGKLIMTVPSENLIAWFPKKDKLEIYNQNQHHVNILGADDWTDLLEAASFTITERYYLFSKTQYKFAIFLDAVGLVLPRGFRRMWRVFIQRSPNSIKRFLFRLLLKPIYKASKSLPEGGELVIVAVKKWNDPVL